MPDPTFDYQSVAGDYQFRAMREGPRLQRFWHVGKLLVWDELIAPQIRDDPPTPIIEVGCGAGLLLQHLAQQPGLKVGADINLQALTFLSKRFVEIGRPDQFFGVESFGERLPFNEGVFGGVILSEVVEHISQPQFMICEVNRVLMPGGWCYLTTPNYHSFWPYLERIVDRFGSAPHLAGEQHISPFNRQKLINLLDGWQIEIVTSFYRFSPFFSMISEEWGKRELLRECQRNLQSGMLLACLARKPL